MKRQNVFKLTNDDWYPNYENNTVRLQYIGLLSDGKYRVAVWGNDDFGFEKDFDTESEAISMFRQLEKYPLITKIQSLMHLK